MTKQQEMLEVLTQMSTIAARILKEAKVERRNSEEEAQKLLAELKSTYAAE